MCPLIVWVHVTFIAEYMSITLRSIGNTCTYSVFYMRSEQRTLFLHTLDLMPSFTRKGNQKLIPQCIKVDKPKKIGTGIKVTTKETL